MIVTNDKCSVFTVAEVCCGSLPNILLDIVSFGILGSQTVSFCFLYGPTLLLSSAAVLCSTSHIY